MKRDITELTQRHIDGIEWWLDSSFKVQLFQCPFDFENPMNHWVPACQCNKIFPGLKSNCPTSNYEMWYIRKVFRWVLSEWRGE